ncbi:MAG: hypothetical protein H6981_11690 [Gammaproteobacteria bacterium]|nr:hypothetical protein [Gammaproteobacteria bacterium]MCP5137450.1 hypothetical protein [Gammaproteobacteria bacterium]
MNAPRTLGLFGITLGGLLSIGAQAAAITYNVSEISSSTEILGGNTGLIAAYNFKSSLVSTDLTLNLADDAVVFNSIYPGGSNGGFSTANLGGGADVNAFMNSSQFSSFSINLTGLTAGDEYRLQILGFAGNFVHYTNVNVDGQTYTNWAVDSSSSLTTADMLTATWTQDAGESSVLIQFSNNPQISGLVLHSVTAENTANATVPVPAGYALLLGGLAVLRLRKRGDT